MRVTNLHDHWHVCAGTAGCIPDMAEVFETKTDALRYAVQEAKDYRDAGYEVEGSARSMHWTIEPINYLEVYPCNEHICREQQEDE